MSIDELKARYPGAETFKFGDNADLCAQLIALVRAGRKTATCGALQSYEDGGDVLPVHGRRDIALNWDDIVGSLEAGKYADMVIIDRDILSCDIDDIKDTKVLETYLAGKRVYAR